MKFISTILCQQNPPPDPPVDPGGGSTVGGPGRSQPAPDDKGKKPSKDKTDGSTGRDGKK
jgi:hypothetical protein